MAEPRQSKRRIQLPVFSGGGGGIEALVVWGGALAVAGLVAAFTVGKGRRVDDHGAKKKQGQIDLLNESAMKVTEDARSKGLQSGIPEAPPFPNENSREKFFEMSKNDPSESVSTQNLERKGERGENKNSAAGHQEMVLSDTEQESIAISEDYCVAEEFPSHSSSMNESENMNKDERKRSPEARSFDAGNATEEKVSSMESSSASSIDEEEEEEDSHTQTTMSSTEEEDESSAIQSTLSDQEGKEDQDEETEGSGSGNSSAESEMEPIWPAEMVEVLSNPKDAKHYPQLSEEKYKKNAKGENPYLGRIGGAGNLKVIKNNNATEYANVAYQSLPQMKRTIFIKSALTLMMMILIANIIWSIYVPEDSSVTP